VGDRDIRVPASTYRLQLGPDFGFDAAAGQARYLADLGVTHAYLSPILQAAPGSAHGYDVVDHSRISAELGGEDGFRHMARELAARGIGIVADIVPNHMSMAAPEYLNRQLWSVLREGQRSRCAHWFDIDWAAEGGRMLLPILAGPVDSCLDDLAVGRLSAGADSAVPYSAVSDTAAGALASQADEAVLRYHDHVLPLRAGTEDLALLDLLAAQHYRLDWWRVAGSSLNWRRFLDIASLIAVRVEEPDVFAATHGLILGLVAEGIIDGLRVDHVDGLTDPRGYLNNLETATDGAWIVAEKVLASGEQLPADWQCSGTTGYDALAAVGALFVDAAGIDRLGRAYAKSSGPSRFGGASEFASVAWTARREIATGPLRPEVARLARIAAQVAEPTLDELKPDDRELLIAELLAAFDVYRTYVVASEQPHGASIEQIRIATKLARRRIPRAVHGALDALAGLLAGGPGPSGYGQARAALIAHFQQACAAIQAKGVEDTAMYRWSRLVCANEVGADPDHPAADAASFHEFADRLAKDWPATMTTLSTHDTKRQEDVRSRLAVLAESPDVWAREVAAWHQRAERLAAGRMPDADTEYLLWQTLAGSWPITVPRLSNYLRKAMREAKTVTSWTDPNLGYEAAVVALGQAILADPKLTGRIAAFVTWITPDAVANSLGAKLVQLTMPGIPDVYQGCELGGFSLVDPDNRRPVDFTRRAAMLAALDASVRSHEPARDEAGPPADGPNTVAETSIDAGKLLVCSRALSVRRDHPDWFAGPYRPLTVSGTGSTHVIAFSRADSVVTVATRLPAGLRRAGGWRDTVVDLTAGRWRDVLTGALHQGGAVQLAGLTSTLPVALLVRDDA